MRLGEAITMPNTITLVSSVSRECVRLAPAHDLYPSPRLRKARAFSEPNAYAEHLLPAWRDFCSRRHTWGEWQDY